MLLLLLDDIKIINFIYAQFSLNSSHHFNNIFTVIFKRKYILNAFNKKKLYPMKEMHNIMTSSEKKYNHYQIEVKLIDKKYSKDFLIS